MEPVCVAIGVGLVVTLLFSELFGLAAGGMVVPGYVALNLDNPLAIIATLLASLATYGIVRWLSQWIIVYGRRRTVLMILVGFTMGALVRFLPAAALALPGLEGVAAGQMAVIGFIIPGLIAIWIDRQGIVETYSVVLTTSVVVRLVLILCLTELRV